MRPMMIQLRNMLHSGMKMRLIFMWDDLMIMPNASGLCFLLFGIVKLNVNATYNVMNFKRGVQRKKRRLIVWSSRNISKETFESTFEMIYIHAHTHWNFVLDVVVFFFILSKYGMLHWCSGQMLRQNNSIQCGLDCRFRGCWLMCVYVCVRASK